MEVNSPAVAGRRLFTLHGIYCAKDNDAAGPSETLLGIDPGQVRRGR